jgi:hypothetical protein
MSKNHKRGPKGLEEHGTTHEVQGNNNQSEGQEVDNIKSEEQSTTGIEQSATVDVLMIDEGGETGSEQSTENEEQSSSDDVPRTKVVAVGIGQFCRYLLLNSNKSNAEILELVLKNFEGAKTTAACIAWYKADLRKRKLLPPGTAGRGSAKQIEFSSEELDAMTK